MVGSLYQRLADIQRRQKFAKASIRGVQVQAVTARVFCFCLGALVAPAILARVPVDPAKKPVAKPAVHTVRFGGAAALIAVAQQQLNSGNLAAAADSAASASLKTPLLNDYAQYIRAEAEYRLQNYAEVTAAATQVFDQDPDSPFVGAATALAVQAQLDSGSAKQAIDLVKEYFDEIPQPQADMLLARCFEANGDLAQAAEYYQRVYYEYPNAKEVTDAANALVVVKQQLGDAYPPPMPTAMLHRAQKLFDAKNPAAARIELAAAIPQLGGAQRDLARVRLGEADYFDNHIAAAFQYFTALKVDDAEANAERLAYLIRCVRKLDKHGDVKPFLEDLEKHNATSPWRLDALVFIADEARADNDRNVYLPLYRTCADTFASDSRSAWCHWRVAFESYRNNASDAYDLLRAHVERYPDSEDVNDALYYLGRWLEQKNDLASARACYDQLVARFPNTYYAVLTRARLDDPGVKAATPNAEMVTFLSAVKWPERPQFPSFIPGETVQARLDRAKLLEESGLIDFAEQELKYGARNDEEQQNVYAYELAKTAVSRSGPDQAVRLIKAYAPDYLYMPLDQAPVGFWELAFPIPYRTSIEQRSRAQGLDPFVVAALIRQESEFNPTVISYANAYGLMQLLPSTGRELARHFGIRRLRTTQLLLADTNIELGTYYFRNLLNSYGEMEIVLASYNAGPGRANLWRTWGPFREPSEFMETVPFHQTRGYIQIVLRNADVYRRLYAGREPDIPVYHPKPPPKKKPAKASKRRRKRPIKS